MAEVGNKPELRGRLVLLSTIMVNMCFLHFMAIALATAEVINPVFSARLPGGLWHGDSKNHQFPKDNSTKENLKVPQSFHKTDAYSKFLSFAFNIPLQRKTSSFYPNTTKTNLHPTAGTLMTQRQRQLGKFLNKTQNGQRGVREGALFKPLQNNDKTLQMVGGPLSIVGPTRKDFGNSQRLGLAQNSPNSSFGSTGRYAYNGNQLTQAGSVPVSTTAVNDMGNKIAPVPRFKEVSSTEGENLLVTDIVEIGKPVMFGLGSKGHGTKQQAKQHKEKENYEHENGDTILAENYKVNNTFHTNNTPTNKYHQGYLAFQPKPGPLREGLASNIVVQRFPLADKVKYGHAFNGGLHSILESIHNAKVPVKEQAQGAQLTDESLNRVYFQNQTITQNKKMQAAIFKQNLTSNNSAKDNYDQGNSQWLFEQDLVSQAELKTGTGEFEEKIEGYGAKDIADNFQQNNDSSGPSSGKINGELLQKGVPSERPPFQITKQDQTPVKVIHVTEKGPEEGQDNNELETEFTNSNYSSNETTNNQENDEFYPKRYDYGQQKTQFSQPQSGGLEEEQTDKSNTEQDQGEHTEEYSLEGNLATPTSNQPYMPVDEFGFPIYGNETDDYFKREALAAHNRYRTIHRAPPLKLDSQLSLEAERFAKHLAQQGGARHEIPGKLRREGEGENVARGCSEWGGLTASGAVHRWYSEVCNFDWNNRNLQPKAKNFMQIIWKGTSHMGIGRAQGTRLDFPCTFIVARYRPGKMSAFDVDSNIDRGLFLPSYCNVDGDYGLMSPGYPSSLLSEGIPPNTAKHAENLHDEQRFQNTEEPQAGVTFELLPSWERDIDEQDAQGFLKEQPDTQAASRFIPHVSYEENQYDEGASRNVVSMLVEDGGLKRGYKPSKENIKIQA